MSHCARCGCPRDAHQDRGTCGTHCPYECPGFVVTPRPPHVDWFDLAIGLVAIGLVVAAWIIW